MPTDEHPPTVRERRRDDTMRAIFEDAYALCAPFLDPRNGYGIPLVHQAVVTLRERYPQLDMLQIYVLVQALQRVHRIRQRNAAGANA
ncbi:MAG: hypothetical protein ACUVVU_00555 [Tepidimonas sp.]|uniref:hypothetical protein n=1 Tax=Tepidimonas sp. TaxID=2002775 RepID=UPI004054E389